MPYDVRSIAIDASGNKWFGTYESGLAKFDGTIWTVYTTSNSGLPNNGVNSIAIDETGNKWLATAGGGLAKYDGTTWMVYNTANSGMPHNWVHSVVIDGNGNTWIGSEGGLSVYKKGGVITSVGGVQKNEIPTTVGLFQNYPNPFNSTTTIKYKVTEPGFVSLKVFNAMGTEVASLVNEQKPKGDYSIKWNASGLAEGIYFCRLQAGKFMDTKKLVLQK